MSKRIGLRTIPSIGAKVPCPSGEQFVNGGFETGDFTGWTHTGGWKIFPYDYHTGLYSAMTSADGVLEQDFSSPIPVACFKTFEVWVAGTYYAPCVLQCGSMYIDILYSDLTYTRIDWTAPSGAWTLINLLSYVEAGKKVTGVRFTWVRYNVLVDDASAVC